MTKDEAIELLLRGKKVRHIDWNKDVFMVVKDGKLTHSKNYVIGPTTSWQKDGWVEYSLDKYQAVDIIFAGGKVTNSGDLVGLYNIDCWDKKFTYWEDNGYAQG